ncbi:hypothetical protein GH146_02895 [archaeon]|jgi:uncharacterized membrane-anchored protein|nr:hypothetical protein [archaeon]
MIELLFWLAWAILFIAALAILVGVITVYKHGTIKGLYITFSGIIVLAISALVMTIACGIP